MKNINDIENILKTAPSARLDPEFKIMLNEQIRNYQTRQNIIKNSFPLWRYVMLIICILAIGVLVGNNFFNTKQTPIDILRPAKVSAAEIIERSREVFLKSGVIYHHKTTQYLEGKKVATYELWEDMDTPMFRNYVIYHDTNRENWQWFDLDVRWDADLQEKLIRKDIYVYDQLTPKDQKLGSMVDLSAVFDKLLLDGTLEAKEGKIDDLDVYVIYDTRESQDKYWDIITFDKQTFRLLKTEKYSGEGDQRYASHIVEYEIIENLERSKENIKKLFLTTPVNLNDFKIFTRYYYINSGSNEEYIPDYKLKPYPNSETFDNPGILEEEEPVLLNPSTPMPERDTVDTIR